MWPAIASIAASVISAVALLIGVRWTLRKASRSERERYAEEAKSDDKQYAEEAKKEQMRWDRERTLRYADQRMLAYDTFASAGRYLADNPHDLSPPEKLAKGTEKVRALDAAKFSIRVIGTAAVYDAAENYHDTLWRYRLTVTQEMQSLPPSADKMNAALKNWEDAEQRFFDAVHRERGDKE